MKSRIVIRLSTRPPKIERCENWRGGKLNLSSGWILVDVHETPPSSDVCRSLPIQFQRLLVTTSGSQSRNSRPLIRRPSPTAMQNAQRRLASTATAQKLNRTIPLSSVRTFPPPQALKPEDSKSPVLFDSDAWAASQPPPSAALTAFAHRVGLGKLGSNPQLIQQACTHQSITLPYSKFHPNKPLPRTNTNLATLGNSLLGLFATEFVHASYPHLPTRVAKAAVSAYVGPTTCADVAKEMGAAPLLRWYRAVS